MNNINATKTLILRFRAAFAFRSPARAKAYTERTDTINWVWADYTGSVQIMTTSGGAK
ncbi:MAG: hypothetical protein V4844_17000 [Pseudomonadota bacterium]